MWKCGIIRVLNRIEWSSPITTTLNTVVMPFGLIVSQDGGMKILLMTMRWISHGERTWKQIHRKDAEPNRFFKVAEGYQFPDVVAGSNGTM